MRQNRNTIFFKTIVLFTIILISISGYFFVKKFFPSKYLSIVIDGAYITDTVLLEEIIRDLVSKKGKAITKKEIQEVLKVEHRIKNIKKIDLVSDKKIYIEIEEYETGYVLHDVARGKFIEKSFNNIDLQDSIIVSNPSLTADIPIIVEDSVVAPIHIKETIIELYKNTKVEYSFIWQRISEISIHDNEIIMYTAHARSAIHTREHFDTVLLKRLWAVFFHIETKYKSSWTDIYIYPKHIALKEVI